MKKKYTFKGWNWCEDEAEDALKMARRFCEHGAKVVLDAIEEDIEECGDPCILNNKKDEWVLQVTVLGHNDLDREVVAIWPLAELLENICEHYNREKRRVLADLIVGRLCPIDGE